MVAFGIAPDRPETGYGYIRTGEPIPGSSGGGNRVDRFVEKPDRATAEEEHWLDLRLRERESLLLRKIDEALRRIAEKEFGYCEKTGDPIGIPRLLARPTATVCVDIKGQDERVEAQFRDR